MTNNLQDQKADVTEMPAETNTEQTLPEKFAETCIVTRINNGYCPDERYNATNAYSIH